MKKNLFLIIPALAIILFASSCSKNDTTTSPGATPQGTWTGTGQYGTGAGSTTYPFTITFKANGTVDITGNNSTAADNATGTWTVVQDTVKATYIYINATAQYKLSGKISSSSNVMAGTIGLEPSTTGIGLFSVTKQ